MSSAIALFRSNGLLLRQIKFSCSTAAAFHSLRSIVPPSGSSIARNAIILDGLQSLAVRPPAEAAGRSAVLGLRYYSVQQSAQQAQQALKAAAAAPEGAIRSAVQALSKAPAAVYTRLPASARRWVDSVQKPGALQRALSLQLEAAWQHHGRKLILAGTLFLAYTIFRAMRASASAFVEVSQSMATTGLMAFAASVAAFASLWFYRRRFVISPDAVYRAAMLRLNTHPGVLEVLGAPVAGSDVRASVLTGGGLKFKGLRPKLRARRVQMIFPLRGAERRGLVSLEAKKKRGELQMRLLAVDVPLPAALGGEQRVYVEGGPKAYSRGGVLDELRRPFLAALTSEEAVEAEEEAEEAAEERAAELKAAVAAEGGVEEGGSGGGPRRKEGMYFYERVYFAVKGWLGGGAAVPPRQLSAPPPPAASPR